MIASGLLRLRDQCLNGERDAIVEFVGQKVVVPTARREGNNDSDNEDGDEQGEDVEMGMNIDGQEESSNRKPEKIIDDDGFELVVKKKGKAKSNANQMEM
eukprot:Nk52_evm33s294 gene=Nk52_evmTU33s294